MRTALAACLILSAGLSLPATAAERAIDPVRSSISAVFTQMGVPVEAPFRKFSGRVDHDPAKPAEARATLVIDTASFDIGDDDYNAEVAKPEWFDSARHPQATFTATSLKAIAGGAFEAGGRLVLKGRTIDLKAPVTIKTVAGGQTYSGTATISRKAFGIGDPAWEDTVEDAVRIRFTITVPAGP